MTIFANLFAPESVAISNARSWWRRFAGAHPDGAARLPCLAWMAAFQRERA